MSSSAVNTYQAVEVQSMSPGATVVFLYEHLAGRIQRALMATDPEIYGKMLGNAQDAVVELRVSLDEAAGGELANNLASIYGFFLSELTRLTVKREDGKLQRLLHQVNSLKDAWEAVAESTDGSSEL